MALPWEGFSFDLELVQHAAPFCWQCLLAQLFLAALSGITENCSVNLSMMSMLHTHTHTHAHTHTQTDTHTQTHTHSDTHT
jgi:hypothetical protein